AWARRGEAPSRRPRAAAPPTARPLTRGRRYSEPPRSPAAPSSSPAHVSCCTARPTRPTTRAAPTPCRARPSCRRSPPRARAAASRSPPERSCMTTYVYYPRGLATGGPEALHQLVDSLRRQGQDAYLVAIPGTEGEPRASRYAHYDAPEAGAVDDAAGNTVVVPETQALLLAPLRRARGFVWWLSIDYAPRFVIERDTTSLLPIERTRNTRFPLLQVRRVKRWARGIATGEDALLQRVGHLAQSHYAWNHVFAHLGRPGSIVSDYTPQVATGAGSADRIARIAYNPAKSRPIMAEFARRWPGIELLPLQNMTGAEVAQALESSLVYLRSEERRVGK